MDSNISSVYCSSNTSEDSITPEMWSLNDEDKIGGIIMAVFEILFISLGLPWNVMVLVDIII